MFAVANYAAATVYAAVLLITLALRGDKATAWLAIIAMACAFVSTYAGHMSFLNDMSERHKTIAHNVGAGFLLIAVAFAVLAIINF